MTLVNLKIFVWIAVFLAVVELSLEVRANYRGWDTLVFGAVNAGESALQQTPGGREFGPTPSFPFRSRIVSVERKSGNHRYWVASSSHAEDRYLPPTVIFPVIFERLLKEDGIDAVVLNASRSGNDIAANVEDLKRWGELWKPEYVILYQMSLTVGSIAKRIYSGNRVQASPSLNQKEKAGGPITWLNRLVEETTIYANMKGQVAARIGANRVLANDLGVQGEREFADMLHEFIGAARAIGATPVLTTFATSHTRKDLSEIPEEIALGLFKYSSFLSVEGWVASIERLNAVMKRVAAQEGVMLIDVESAVAGRPQYFRDFVHFTPEGHEAVAQTMRTALVELERRNARVSVLGQKETL